MFVTAARVGRAERASRRHRGVTLPVVRACSACVAPPPASQESFAHQLGRPRCMPRLQWTYWRNRRQTA
eukprot:6202107-Pleurochrysis_carterae.AAC.2